MRSVFIAWMVCLVVLPCLGGDPGAVVVSQKGNLVAVDEGSLAGAVPLAVVVDHDNGDIKMILRFDPANGWDAGAAIDLATRSWLADDGEDGLPNGILLARLVGQWEEELRQAGGEGLSSGRLAVLLNERLQQYLDTPVAGSGVSPRQWILSRAASIANGAQDEQDYLNPCIRMGAACEMKYECVDPETGERYFCDCDDSCLDCCVWYPDPGLVVERGM